jgi:glycosyl-4,4'-diaponeurosporenoate acyltransferase
MRLIHLPTFWTVVVDIIAWLVIHMGVVYVMIRIPLKRFDPECPLCRSRKWERDGRMYQDVFKIRKWKKYLPDGAPFLGTKGFPKSKLGSRQRDYFETFLEETCRAEWTHWIIMLFAPLFFLWNTVAVGFIMIFYAAAENIPLVMAQRYNRCRFKRVLGKERSGN